MIQLNPCYDKFGINEPGPKLLALETLDYL